MANVIVEAELPNTVPVRAVNDAGNITIEIQALDALGQPAWYNANLTGKTEDALFAIAKKLYQEKVALEAQLP